MQEHLTHGTTVSLYNPPTLNNIALMVIYKQANPISHPKCILKEKNKSQHNMIKGKGGAITPIWLSEILALKILVKTNANCTFP